MQQPPTSLHDSNERQEGSSERGEMASSSGQSNDGQCHATPMSTIPHTGAGLPFGRPYRASGPLS